MSEERETAALVMKFIFQKSGKDVMTREEILISLSAEQAWLSPEEAKGFLRNSIGRGLIRHSPDGLTPSQEVKDAPISGLVFNPDRNHMVQWSKKQDLFQKTLNEIINSTGMEKKKIIAEANKIAHRLNVDAKVALLMVGMRHGIDVSGMADEIEQDLIERRIDEEEKS